MNLKVKVYCLLVLGLISGSVASFAQAPRSSPCRLKRCDCTTTTTIDIWKSVPAEGYEKSYNYVKNSWHNQYASKCSVYDETAASYALRDGKGNQIGIVKYKLRCADGPMRCAKYTETAQCGGTSYATAGPKPIPSPSPKMTISQETGYIAPMTAPGECSDLNTESYGEYGGYDKNKKWIEGWFMVDTKYDFIGYYKRE